MFRYKVRGKTMLWTMKQIIALKSSRHYLTDNTGTATFATIVAQAVPAQS
jgi:hypothetical protein